MPRIRTIKPEFPQSESMGRVSRDSRLAFIEMWTVADDSGRLRGNSRMIASILFPYDDDAPKLMDGWLDELEREQCILRYEVDGQKYIQIVNFNTHQKIEKPSPSKLPSFDDNSVNTPRKLTEASRKMSLDQGRDQGEDQGEERMQGEEKAPAEPSPPPPPPEKPRKSPHGEFGIMLADQEYEKLTAKYGRKAVDSAIDSAGGWLRANGRQKKDHYAFVLNWMKKDNTPELGPKVFSTAAPEVPDEELATPEEISRVMSRLPLKRFA